MLGVIVKWLMGYIDGQAKRIESISKDANETQLKMAEAFNKTIRQLPTAKACGLAAQQ